LKPSGFKKYEVKTPIIKPQDDSKGNEEVVGLTKIFQIKKFFIFIRAIFNLKFLKRYK